MGKRKKKSIENTLPTIGNRNFEWKISKIIRIIRFCSKTSLKEILASPHIHKQCSYDTQYSISTKFIQFRSISTNE